MTETAIPSTIPTPAVVLRGEFGAGVGDYATGKLTKALSHAHHRVQLVRVTVTRLPDPAVAEPVRATADIDLDGRHVHVRADATGAREAIDRLAHRLAHRLSNLWHRPSKHRNTARPSSTPGRQVVSHVTYSAPGVGIEDAIAEMDSLGYDFHLFTDAAGQDCLLRKTTSGYLVAAVDGRTPATPTGVWECVGSAPRLTVEEAQVRFDLSGQRLLFYADADDNRGRVLYRRDDGDYGLIHPAP
ncbi:Sigma 54 modulation/S30EA ribosomal protein C terminus [Actinokineospora alba]|uniref:Sigma 54 modulation/S30EA ribosomal protein C terminus n=1 Tax=Actinokineospora alba TaxID=504798 RepID=A0A1H0FN92_9PSEU|nr:sigma 54 modulation/S30EA ribosomal C-terminal domain-containing protein [Actinokineospora alba]TDP69546.1 sigma 54 modulation/S30EA-like ribosomal protein [Actinokineospora alba]SDI14514.1 Sigma 54 modulation/S30EA ribosomal protein C terminus [Actinokineospora alba]SDN96090.1 Sigma 54 modulation/S30EA ribosomal protein C terminus [Actinokineospora alba]